MKQKLTLKIVLLTIALTGTFLILRSSSPAQPDSAGTESLDASCKKQESSGVIWENISHQFFSSF
ncbi:MAG: hypothetical protein J0I32_03535 [Sphingobacteriales bacterium]|jgi:hypothetical protein|nr:hypothetical protein [Sphingobacteriales bacterium]OJW05075.1 MAG: hypothetical protein BGO52_21595 [Sphingobacteriales bacterium 44-61]